MRTIEWYADGGRLRIDLDTAQYVYVPANAEDETDCEWFDDYGEAIDYARTLTQATA